MIEGKISKKLKKLLKKLYVNEIRDDVLAVADKKLSMEINVRLSFLSDYNFLEKNASLYCC